MQSDFYYPDTRLQRVTRQNVVALRPTWFPNQFSSLILPSVANHYFFLNRFEMILNELSCVYFQVTLVTVSNSSRLLEGQNVRMICSVVANPPDVSYRWYINEQLILSDPTTELILRNVSQVNHNSVVRCEVTNAVGKSQDSQVLNISCKLFKYQSSYFNVLY